MSRCDSAVSSVTISESSAPQASSSPTISLALSLAISLAISLAVSLVTDADVDAKLYTYEREDGVIVISSEPPARSRRLKRRRPKRRDVNRSSNRRVKRSTKRANKRRARREGQRSGRAHHREKSRGTESSVDRTKPRLSSRGPHRLRRYRSAVERAAADLSLPPTLIWSVITACDELKARLPRGMRGLEGEEFGVSYLSSRVRAARFPELLRTELSSAEVEVKGIAILLRELIQLYHGDLTLVLSSYPHAARSDDHPVYQRTRGQRPLFASAPPAPRRHTLTERQRRARFYITRRALELYQRSP